ncbi:G2/mitotic-specific cyclin S13-7 isoform X2 [Tripterygium wilfordii]|uniref:B-like cyclin n=1 Tax=Tripterygium wilfordii TaxID=458696 RepID=A0A7J7C823_TRIWF|nr:G2/mitotic-specific cyclin S13-7 isoform X2 [Tripterygium wilfordii]
MTEVSSIVHSGVSSYVKEIYEVYKQTEGSSVVDDYMSRQPEINEESRAILVDWLNKIHTHMSQLAQETFYLTINILDRFLAKETVKMNEIKLVGMAAMVVSCKYDEEEYPNAETFREAPGIENSSMENTFSQEQINAMEEKILLKLNWKLTVPTPYVFIVRCLRACSDGDSKMRSLIFYLSELSMAHYATIKYSPSMLAASAVYVARRMLKPQCQWSKALEVHSGYKKRQLKYIPHPPLFLSCICLALAWY